MEDMEHPEGEHPEGFTKENYNWVPDFVYGGIDGAVTTFAVVAGVEGASLSIPIILVLGFANLFADGFSMATSKYLSDKSHMEEYERIRQIEFRHVKEYAAHETQEVKEIMSKYGFKGKDLERATKIITSDPEGWVDLMMRHEFNMTQENINPTKGAGVTFAAFILIGAIPLSSYLMRGVLPLTDSQLFMTTTVATLGALFLVGAVKARFETEGWLKAGLETAVLGGVAAGISYGIGFLLRGLVM